MDVNSCRRQFMHKVQFMAQPIHAEGNKPGLLQPRFLSFDYCTANVMLVRIASVSVPSERSTPVSLMLTQTPSAISP